MKKIISIVALVVLTVTFLVSPVAAESQELLCRVDIGDPASEEGHNLVGWGPIEPDTNPWLDYGAPWSELGDGNARVIWTVDGDYPWATLTLDRHLASGNASSIRFKHLDGINLTGYDGTECWADDSFTVSVKNHGDADDAYQVVYTYEAIGRATSTSTWLVHEVDLPSSLNLDEDIDVKFSATASRWEYFGSDLGQVPFDWIELWGEGASSPSSPPDNAREKKEASLEALEEAKGDDSKLNKRINRIQKLINASLNEDWWEDDSRLDPKSGRKVFDRELAAALSLEVQIKLHTHLEKIIAAKEERGKDASRERARLEAMETALAPFQTALDYLTAADQILAEVALNDALNMTVNNPRFERNYNRYIAKAEQQMDSAVVALEDGRATKAIKYFKKSWSYAQRAIKYASRS
jgi:hypothetical protein